MSENDGDKEPHIGMGESIRAFPKEVYDNSGEVPPRGAQSHTFAADYANVYVDEASHLCTLTFYQTYPLGEMTSKGFQISQITHRPFLIVKIPLEQLLGVSEFLHLILPKIREDYKTGKLGRHYGPVSIKQVEELK